MPEDFAPVFVNKTTFFSHTSVHICIYKGRGCDQIMRVGFTLLGIFPDITDRISSI